MIIKRLRSGNLKNFKFFIVILYIFSTIFLLGSTPTPTKEQLVIEDFLNSIYSFKNDEIPIVLQHNSIYPKDSFLSRVKPYMTKTSYDKLTSKKLQNKYVKLAVDMGFDSECDIIKITKVGKSNNYDYFIKVHVIFSDTGTKESYIIKGSISLNNNKQKPKINICPNISIPSIGSSNLTSKLV